MAVTCEVCQDCGFLWVDQVSNQDGIITDVINSNITMDCPFCKAASKEDNEDDNYPYSNEETQEERERRELEMERADAQEE